jgi:concanavalin A-like lectin/glucanase superfamily protein
MKHTVVLMSLAACGSVANKNPVDAPPAHDGKVDAPHSDAPGIDAPTCAQNPPGLAARWRGDSTAADDTGTYNGTAVGSVAYVPGKHGMAFELNGTNELVSINDGDALWPASSFSIEAWVNTTNATTSSYVISKYQCMSSCPNNVANAFYGISLTAAGVPYFDVRPDGSNAYAEIFDPAHHLNDGAWHHLVGVRDIPGAKLVLYVDGALVVSTNLAGAALGPLTNNDGEVDPVLIGGSGIAGQAGYSAYFSGAIDEVSYYTSPLTAAQVAAIYAAPLGECH